MGWLDSNFIYQSGDKPKYKVGDKAYRIRIEYEILEVSKKKSGFIFKEFTYTIKALDNGEVIKDVYESELYDEWVDFHSPKDPNINWDEEIEKLYEDSL